MSEEPMTYKKPHMPRDDQFDNLVFQMKAAQTWILDRPHSAVSLGDVFRLCGAVQMFLDYASEQKKAEAETGEPASDAG